MSGSLYSQMKVAHHADRLVDLKAGRPTRPVHVQIILSDLCNQDCSFCAYRMSSGLSTELFALGDLAATGHNNPKRQIPTARALDLVDECAALDVKAIQFTGGGEPTVHPDHLAIFERAQLHGIETALVTNGVKLSPEHPAIRAMRWIRVSVDAGDATMYAAVRRVPTSHWTKVWTNLALLAQGYEGVLGVGYVVTPENFRGIIDAARAAKRIGAANIRVGAVFSERGTGYYSQLALDAIPEIVAIAKAELDGDGFEVVDLFGRRLDDLSDGHPDDPSCGYQHLTWYVGGDLNLYRCCNTAYTTAGLVGNLKDARLKDMIGRHEPFDARGCRHCQFLGQNRAIQALTVEPDHVNFV